MKDKTKKWLAIAGLLAVCAVLVFGISRVLYHEPDREAQAVERESEETELFVETETLEPAPAESTEAEMEEPLVIETETGTSVNDREQEIQETPEKTEEEKPSEPPALSEGTATDQPDTPPSYEEENRRNRLRQRTRHQRQVIPKTAWYMWKASDGLPMKGKAQAPTQMTCMKMAIKSESWTKLVTRNVV